MIRAQALKHIPGAGKREKEAEEMFGEERLLEDQ